MSKVYKYTEVLNDYIEILLPVNARVLRLDTQDDGLSKTVHIWALVDPEAAVKPRRFRIAGTGHQIDESSEYLNYINTFTTRSGALWFHAFEVLRY